MIALYIDTTSNYLYTGISKDNLLLVDRMFEEVKITPNDIDKIIVVNGPGSFTGIRIGVTIAKVFAYLLHKDITTISSLEAMNVSVNDNKLHVPIINARRGYVYGAIYDGDKEVLEPEHISLEKLKLIVMGLNRDYVFISNDSFNNLDVVSYDPDINLIINKYQDRESINPHLVNPIYLKLTEAEENKLKDN